MGAQDLYTDKEGNDVTLGELVKNKTADQVKALKFFQGIPISQGCFSKQYLSESEYQALVRAKRGEGNRDRALKKLGIDEDQVREIAPVCFEGYRYEYSKLRPYTTFVEGSFYSSMYEVTWLFFGDDQVYVHNYAFDTTDNTVMDTTQEYFYKDITAFATRSDSVQRKLWIVKKDGCARTRESQSKNVETDMFRIVVPGEVFECAYRNVENASQQISAMKQKLREKKQ